jgi:hypothetical protein
MFNAKTEVNATILLDTTRKPVLADKCLGMLQSWNLDWYPDWFKAENVLALIPIKYTKERDEFVKKTLAQEFFDLPQWIPVYNGESITHKEVIETVSSGNCGYPYIITLHPEFEQDAKDHLTWSLETLTDIWENLNDSSTTNQQ